MAFDLTSPEPAKARRDSFADVDGLRIGHWTDNDAATGCTVILGPHDGFAAAVSVRGGAPGTRETDAMQPGNLVTRIHALLLSGGSAFGLDAAGGVMRFLEERGIGFETRAARVPIVAGAVLYDLAVGSATIRPNDAAGYAACVSSVERGWPEGSVGAGTGATVAKAGGIARALKGGIGSASERLHDGVTVAALAAVNAYGDIYDSSSGRFIATPRPDAAGTTETALELLRRQGSHPEKPLMNTTLVVIATAAALTRDQLLRVAEMGHAGIARAVQPSHTPADGDIVFAISTGLYDGANSEIDITAIGTFAAVATSRAIVRAVTGASSLAGIPAASARSTTTP